MKNRDPKVYLEDIFNSIKQIEEYAKGGKKVFMREHMKQDAIIRQLAVIGEATKKLPASLTKKYPKTPWKSIAGMRDILVHDYANIDPEIVWNAVKKELPKLRKIIEKLLKNR